MVTPGGLLVEALWEEDAAGGVLEEEAGSGWEGCDCCMGLPELTEDAAAGEVDCPCCEEPPTVTDAAVESVADFVVAALAYDREVDEVAEAGSEEVLCPGGKPCFCAGKDVIRLVGWIQAGELVEQEVRIERILCGDVKGGRSGKRLQSRIQQANSREKKVIFF